MIWLSWYDLSLYLCLQYMRAYVIMYTWLYNVHIIWLYIFHSSKDRHVKSMYYFRTNNQIYTIDLAKKTESNNNTDTHTYTYSTRIDVWLSEWVNE